MELLSYDFIQRAIITSVILSVACSVIGVFVVLRNLSFIGAGTAHAAFAGVALAYLLGVSPMPLALLFGLSTAWMTGLLQERGKLKLDVSIGIIYTSTMALAILFIGLMPGYNASLYGYLFGSVLSVGPSELWFVVGLAIGVLVCVFLFYKEFQFIAFDQEMAEASGVPARRLFFLLLTLIALTIVVSLKVVGALLVFALILIPPATAYQWTRSLKGMFVYSVAIGIAVCLTGMGLSLRWNLPAGAAIVLTATALFFLSVWISPKKRFGGKKLETG